MYVDKNKIDIKHYGWKWLQAITIACSPQHKCRSSYDTCFVSFCLYQLTLFNCFNFFLLSYVVLFPRRLSPKLPVLTLALADSSTSKQKTDTEPGIFILRSYCLLETLLAMPTLLTTETVGTAKKGILWVTHVFKCCPYFHQFPSSTHCRGLSSLSNGPLSLVSAVFFFSCKSGKIKWLALLCCV